MVRLEEVYDSVENPIESEETLKKILSAYEKADRTNLFGGSNIYEALVKMNQNKDESGISFSDRESFMVEAYNQWIENMLKLDEKQIENLERTKGMAARQMQQYLRSFGKISSMEDIKRLKSNPLFEEQINGWELEDGGWEHMKSQYISARKESKIGAKHRLYVGCQNQDIWKVAQLFKEKCEAQKIPFYFKLAASKDRDDKIVIYADTDNLGKYIDVLKEIGKENPEIIQRCGNPPAMTGKIDGWIGIGDEPPKKSDGKNQSYNQLRARVFEDAIEETLLGAITEFKGQTVEYRGKSESFNRLFLEQAAQTIMQKNGGSLSEPEFVALRKNIQKGLNKLLEVKDKKDQLGGSNGTPIFEIPTKTGKSISVNTYDMDAIIKSMVPIMQEVDAGFMEKVKLNIQEKCRQNCIDDKFCFQQGTREEFRTTDLSQQTEQAKKTNSQQTKINEGSIERKRRR